MGREQNDLPSGEVQNEELIDDEIQKENIDIEINQDQIS